MNQPRNELVGEPNPAGRPQTGNSRRLKRGGQRFPTQPVTKTGHVFKLVEVWEGEAPAEPGLNIGHPIDIEARPEPRPPKPD